MKIVHLYEVDHGVQYDHEGHYQEPYPVFGDHLPPSQVVAAAQKVLDHEEPRCPKCESPIGFHLWEDEDDYGRPRAGLTFCYFAILFDSEKAWPVCEDCAEVLVAP